MPVIFENVLMMPPTGAPNILSASVLPSGVQGTPYTFTLTANGGQLPYVWSLVSGSFPSGVSLSSAGVISGTPGASGTSTPTIKVTDARGLFSTKAFTVTYAPLANPLTITTTSPLPSASQYTPYSNTMAATGGTPPYTWSITVGSLAAGLTFSSGGVFGGQTNNVETDNVTIQVKDSLNNTASDPFTLVVASNPLNPTWPMTLPSAFLSTPYNYNLTATGGLTPYTFSLVSSSGSNSWSVATSGLLTGTPGATETDSLLIQVADSAGNSVQVVTSLLVTGATNVFKFNPSFFYANYNIYNTPSSDVPTDLTKLNSFPLPPNQIPAYCFGLKWSSVEVGTGNTNLNSASQYSMSEISSYINLAQNQFPSTGCRIGIYMSFLKGSPSIANIPSTAFASSNNYQPVWVTLSNNTPGTMSVPTSFGSGSSISGATAPIYAGSSYYNLIFANYNSADSPPDYGYVMPDFRNPLVQQAIIQMFQYLATATFTITNGPFAGTWTLDTCPCVEYIASNDEISWTFNQGPYQPQTPSGVAAATWQNINSGYAAIWNAAQTCFPHTIVGSCISYGTTGSNGAAQNQDIGAMINPVIPYSSGSVTRFTPTIAMSGADTYGLDWNASTSWANPAKQEYMGRGPPGINSWNQNGPIAPVTTTSQVGNVPYVAQIQPSDQGKALASGIAHNSAGSMLALMQSYVVPKATHVIICSGDGVGGNTAPWGNYIQPTLLSNYTTYNLTTLLPVNLMASPTGLTTSSLTATAVTLQWNGQASGTGTGLTYTLYQNGTAITSNISISLPTTSASVTGLTAGNTYTFSVAVSNANGAGPQSALVVTMPLVSVVNTTIPMPLIGVFYSVTFTATGGTAPYTWSSTGLPSWASLNSTTGVLSGTPTDTLIHNIQIFATDAHGNISG